MSLLTFVAILGSLSLGASAQVLLRKGMMTMSMLPPSTGALDVIGALAINLWVYAGLICYAGSMVPWLFVLSRLPVSVAYPMVSLGYILTALMGWLFLGEMVTLTRISGIVFICAGVVLVARSL